MCEQPTWRNALNDVPCWEDMGRTIRAKLVSGDIVMGVLQQYDMTPGPDELPLFKLMLDDLTPYSWFDDVVYWYSVPNGAAK